MVRGSGFTSSAVSSTTSPLRQMHAPSAPASSAAIGAAAAGHAQQRAGQHEAVLHGLRRGSRVRPAHSASAATPAPPARRRWPRASAPRSVRGREQRHRAPRARATVRRPAASTVDRHVRRRDVPTGGQRAQRRGVGVGAAPAIAVRPAPPAPPRSSASRGSSGVAGATARVTSARLRVSDGRISGAAVEVGQPARRPAGRCAPALARGSTASPAVRRPGARSAFGSRGDRRRPPSPAPLVCSSTAPCAPVRWRRRRQACRPPPARSAPSTRSSSAASVRKCG